MDNELSAMLAALVTLIGVALILACGPTNTESPTDTEYSTHCYTSIAWNSPTMSCYSSPTEEEE